MLQPKRTKFRKQQKGKNRGIAWRGSDVSFGDFGLQATESSFVTSRQIEACRMAIQRHVKRAGKLWIRVFPDKPGKVMFELAGIPEADAREAFRLAGTKLPLAVRVLARGDL